MLLIVPIMIYILYYEVFDKYILTVHISDGIEEGIHYLLLRLETQHGWNFVSHALGYITASKVCVQYLIYDLNTCLGSIYRDRF